MNRDLRPERLLFASLGAIFGLLFAAALLGSCMLDRFDFGRYTYEYSHYEWDALYWTMPSLLALLLLMGASTRRLSGPALRPAALCVLGAHAAFACAWVLAVRVRPVADAAELLAAAQRFAQGNLSFVQSSTSYLRIFPYQLGYTALLEVLVRLFGGGAVLAAQLVNVLALCAILCALYTLTGRLFGREAQACALLLGAGCVQPALMCTFVYGNLVGAAFLLVGLERMTAFLHTGRRAPFAVGAVCLALSVVLKYNGLIGALAMAITLLLRALRMGRGRRLAAWLAAALVLAAPIGAQRGVTALYGLRTGADFRGGQPMILWMAMGLHEQFSRASGWYDGYSYYTYVENGADAQVATQEALQDIIDSLYGYVHAPSRFLHFLPDKLLSQWIEPTFQSVWVNRISGHAISLPRLVRSLQEGRLNPLLEGWMNVLQTLVYLCAALGLLRLSRGGGLLHLPLALTVFGGGLYHMLFEAKALYILPYFLMLLPYAAYGLCGAAARARALLEHHARRAQA